jgi:uncharacterized integral membrane protein
MRILAFAGLALAAIVFAVFAIHNDGATAVDLWPLPFEIRLPLFILVIGAVLAGFLLGWAAAWRAGSRRRRALGAKTKEAAALKGQVEELRARLPAPANGAR